MLKTLLDRWRNQPVSVAIALIGLAVMASLGMAYLAEYGFKLLPCELCLLQRKPFFAVIALALAALVWRKAIQRKVILALMGVALLANSGIALYHTGVEQKWWQGPTECSADDLKTGQSLEEIRAAVMAAPLIRCDTPAWEFHGITMASMNIFFCLFLSAFAFVSLYAATRPKA